MSVTIQVGGRLRDTRIEIAQIRRSETKTIAISGTSLSLIFSYIPVGSDFRRQEILQRETTAENVDRVLQITPGTLIIEFGTGTIT